MKIGAVLMASGLSRRFGENKLLYPLDGIPVYQRVFFAYPAGLFSQVCVVSGYDEILTAATDESYLAVRNPSPEKGQAESIRLGVEALGHLDALLFAVCDQPWLTMHSVSKLRNAYHWAPGGTIAALSWRGAKGNPVIFNKIYFEDLSKLTGDVGGSAVIRPNVHRLLLVEAYEEKELLDIDSMEDL